MRRALILSVVLIVSCLTSSGCLTIGPQVRREFIIVRVGNPIEILQNVTVRGRRLQDNGTATQDIGGWIAMPRDHFEALLRAAGKWTPDGPEERLPDS